MKKEIYPLTRFLDEAAMSMREFAGYAGITYGGVYRICRKRVMPLRHNAMKIVQASQRISKDLKERKDMHVEPLKPSDFGIYDYD